MAVEALKSASVTSLDATPQVIPTAGRGSSGRLKSVGDYVTIPASANTGSTFRVVRIPTNAIVKNVWFESEAQGAGKFDISVYYSTSTRDGTPPDKQGVVVPSTGAGFFATIIDCASAVARSIQTNESGNNTLDKRNSPLWSALGLTSDPGGFFDIVAVCAATAVTTGTGKLGIDVDYID